MSSASAQNNVFNPFGGSSQPQQQQQQQQQPQGAMGGGLVNLDPMALSSHNSFAQTQAAEAIKNPFAPKMSQGGSTSSGGYQWQTSSSTAQPTLGQLSQQRAQTFTGVPGGIAVAGGNNPLFGVNPNTSWSGSSSQQQQQPVNPQQNLFGGPVQQQQQQQQQQPLFGGPMGQQPPQHPGQPYMGGGSLF